MLPERFLRHVLHHRLLPPRGRILVAVSGGLDSVALLELIRSTLPDATIAVAHFDHGWRDSSAADADRVRTRASTIDAEFLTERAAPTSHTETSARAARYAFLDRAAAAWNADAIATAHHADDQAETVLFRMARGAGTHGLRGIPSRRGLYRRPLLPFRRTEIQQFAVDRGLSWGDDPTNLDTRHARNRIRHTLLPALERATAGTTDRLLAIAAAANEAEQAWKSEVRAAVRESVIASDTNGFTLASTVLLGYHPHIRARVLRALARRLGTDLGRAGTRRGSEFISTGRSGSAVDLARDVRLAREFDRFVLNRPVQTGMTDSAMDSGAAITECDVGSCGAADVLVGDRRIRVRWDVSVRSDDRAEFDSASFDPSSLRFPLIVRGWRAGDQIRLSYGSKKLKKLFVERRVGRSQRHRVPILAEAESGRVLWMAGIARAAEAAPVSGAPTFRIRIEE
jgi:tRNA(Ile)-lysidine synthase